MDNRLKMLLGVLLVTGLIAMVIPDKDPLTPKAQEARAQSIVSVPENTHQLPLPAPAPVPVQFNADSGSDFQIGAPAIDGNPTQPNFGLPFGTSMQTGDANPDAGQTSIGSFTPTAFTMPGAATPTDAPGADKAMIDQ
ncbi:MAG: hypothetical protein K9G25_03600 [Sphingomonadaceae bacterium]|nr:hypothetical protein [Sphingomonadaceae bacterium]